MPAGVLLDAQVALQSEALWVAPGTLGELEDAVVATVTGDLLSSRGIDPTCDLQVHYWLSSVMQDCAPGGSRLRCPPHGSCLGLHDFEGRM